MPAAHLFNPPAADDGDAVGQPRRLVEIVRDEQRRHPRPGPQLEEHRLEVAARDGVKRPERLIEQHHRRAGRDGTRERHALALPAREQMRPAGAERRNRQAHEIERRRRERRSIRAPDEAGHERRILGDRPVRQQAAVLGHVADPTAQAHRVGGRHGLVPDERLAAIERREAVEHAQQRALSRAALADERHALPRRHVERHVVERNHVTETFRHAHRAQDGGAHHLTTRRRAAARPTALLGRHR
jgi:hypothetical protein